MVASLLADLSSRGISLSVLDGQVRARPRRCLTPEVRASIAEHRDDIVAALREPERLLPLDEGVVSWNATKHTLVEIEARIKSLEMKAARPNADRLEAIKLDDWRRIRATKIRRLRSGG